MDGGDPNLPRAFALDVTVEGATIDCNVSDLSSDFWVYPGSIDINETTGVVDNNGTPVAICGASSMTIEMGSLYKMGTDPDPCDSGILLKFSCSGPPTSVTLAENAARGGVDSNGVVMEDTTKVFAQSYVTLTTSGCGVVVCPGDVADNYSALNPDDQISIGDVYAILGQCMAYGVDPFYEVGCPF
jgi:hypothetical protein